MTIETREGWDKLLLLNYSEEVKRELTFWQENVCKSNFRRLAPYSPSSVVIYSEASNVACGAYSVEIANKIFHKIVNSDVIKAKINSAMRYLFIIYFYFSKRMCNILLIYTFC